MDTDFYAKLSDKPSEWTPEQADILQIEFYKTHLKRHYVVLQNLMTNIDNVNSMTELLEFVGIGAHMWENNNIGDKIRTLNSICEDIKNPTAVKNYWKNKQKNS